ncbi:ATP-dependent Clp protease proteolytic subunit [bacterium]|nr:ATP-dependent Clp protease proteolytic subunit [bacterium]
MNWKYNNTAEEGSEMDATAIQAIVSASVSSGAGGNCIRVVENTVYFYGDITESNMLDLNSTLHAVDKKLQISGQFLEVTPVINLYINSYGGSLFAGLATVDTIRRLKSEVHSVIDGAAASAATIISTSCAKRSIGKYSKMLIHQLSAGAYGKYTELEDDMENNKHLMETIKSIYKEYTKVPMKKLNEILKHDLWFDSKTCLELGLVDEII